MGISIQRYMTGPIGVNTYLVFDETKEGFIVDPGGESQELLEQVKEKQLHIGYILLTHGHGDHIGWIEDLRKIFPGIQVVANENEKALLENPRFNDSPSINGYPISVKADRFVADEETMKIGNMKIRFLYTPGHTPGGQSIVVGHYVFSGDTLFQLSVGRTDFPGGNYAALIQSIKEKLFKLPEDTVVLPGHMDITTIEVEKEHNPFVNE
ncbi:MAG: MBL fold metallo-hydrolase [Eubacteriales bacterium]|nr:MBL fold metallo-hydrolase [Eubacteriales bacterium]